MWFSNPKCPLCGQDSSLATAWDGDYYTCYPCNKKARKEEERKQKLEARIASLEKQLKEK